jgi:hypothetical protein
MNVTSGMFKDVKKQGNLQKRFAFIVKSCVHFQSFCGVHNNMSVDKLQQLVREKEGRRSEHKQRQEEEVKLLRKIEVEDDLKITKKGVLNI